MVIKLKKLAALFEVDHAVFWGTLNRFWVLISGPVTIILIISFFTKELQGFYYTFASILACRYSFEMGFSTVTIQFASHEWTHLKLNSSGSIEGDENAYNRLISLGRLVITWFAAGGVLISILLATGGYIFFSYTAEGYNINWTLPWLLLSFFTGIQFVLLPFFAILQGCGQIHKVFFMQFIDSVISRGALWFAIIWGAKLFSSVFLLGFSVFISLIFIFFLYRNFFLTFLNKPGKNQKMNWRSEILPMQWRMAVSSLSGFFVFYLINPIAFKYFGAVIAGQLGLTLNLINTGGVIVNTWVEAKIPKFGHLIAKKNYRELDRLFYKLCRIVLVLLFSGFSLFFFVLLILNRFEIKYASRFLTLQATFLFLLASLIMFSSLPFSAYLRAHKKEPLMILSLLGGILIGCVFFICGKYFDITIMGISYFICNLLLVPGIIFVWYLKRKEWHVDEQKIY